MKGYVFKLIGQQMTKEQSHRTKSGLQKLCDCTAQKLTQAVKLTTTSDARYGATGSDCRLHADSMQLLTTCMGNTMYT